MSQSFKFWLSSFSPSVWLKKGFICTFLLIFYPILRYQTYIPAIPYRLIITLPAILFVFLSANGFAWDRAADLPAQVSLIRPDLTLKLGFSRLHNAY